MNQFTRIVSALLFLSGVTMALTIGLARLDAAGSNGLRALGFDVCTGQPCYRGIIPGVTAWADVQKMMGRPDTSYTVNLGYGNTIWIARDPNQPLLTSKVAYEYTTGGQKERQFRLGDVMSLYGQPCGGMRYTAFGLLLSLPKGVSITVNYNETHLLPRNYLYDFEITALHVCQFHSEAAQILLVKWRGFRNTHAYDNPGVLGN